jgi:2-polyprenyl-3-methyl-5-hydroxy-6-metoxy-1,4-benzoquinol methylase
MSTIEPQYNQCLEQEKAFGRTKFGLMSNLVWADDPKRLLFVLSRYKFVSKMLAGMNSALEIGCADGFGTRLVRQVVPNVLATDIDPIFIQDCVDRAQPNDKWNVSYLVHDIIKSPVLCSEKFDAAFSLDVFEHIAPYKERLYIENIVKSIKSSGMFIVGCPSLESQEHASAGSLEGHVNCKTGQDLKALYDEYFNSVLLFSMNDEVVHTGFHKMANYLFAVCCGAKNVSN